eukprot:4990880-Prymnesium_polylepis.1
MQQNNAHRPLLMKSICGHSTYRAIAAMQAVTAVSVPRSEPPTRTIVAEPAAAPVHVTGLR